MASTFTGSDAGRAGLEITEVDGVPDIFGVNKITVSNTTLTDDGNGAVTITTGGGGGGSGTVTSVGLSGGTTGLTVTGSPITTSGTITLGGTLALGNGGTGATTASGARTNLGLGTAAVEDTSFFATAAQGSLADSATQPGDNVSSLTNDAGYTTNVGTVTSISAGSNLNAGGVPITGIGLIDLLFDTHNSSAPAGGAAGFVGPPPDDTGKVQSGWITVDVMISPGGGAPAVQTPAYIPLWVNA
tara:strand:+ start:4070 stop:4801 length:732 start_codon:yes stop_codon:yes gene_type:complete